VVADPTGLGATVTAGVVTGVRRETGTPPEAAPEDVLLTDAARGAGALGAALVTDDGRVAGVVVRTGADGAAVPVALAAGLARALADGDRPALPYLGAAATDDAEGGARVAGVRAGSPAARAGLASGDRVTDLAGRPLDGASALADAVAASRPGDTLALTVVRGGAERAVRVTVGERPAG
jgi:putative serine protease PepD